MILLFFQRVKTGPRHCEENYEVIDEAISEVWLLCHEIATQPTAARNDNFLQI
ncbi:MAG: hypothetical protein AB8U82_06090 [Rickettsia endosymbiont of Haemaphysalis japonica]